MSELRIDEVKDRVELFGALGYDLGTIKNAFGNVVAMLNHTSDECFREPNAIINHIDNVLNDNDDIECIWEFDTSLFEINLMIANFLDNRTEIALKADEINRIRREYGILVNDEPIEPKDYECINGMRFNNVRSVKDVIYCILFYYSNKGLKIKRCLHCGRWFAAPKFDVDYCSRLSIAKGYTHLTCKAAAQNMRQECSRVKNRIETKARNSLKGQLTGGNPDFINQFQIKCDTYLKHKPFKSANNLSEYLSFLRNTDKKREWLK